MLALTGRCPPHRTRTPGAPAAPPPRTWPCGRRGSAGGGASIMPHWALRPAPPRPFLYHTHLVGLAVRRHCRLVRQAFEQRALQRLAPAGPPSTSTACLSSSGTRMSARQRDRMRSSSALNHRPGQAARVQPALLLYTWRRYESQKAFIAASKQAPAAAPGASCCWGSLALCAQRAGSGLWQATYAQA